MYRAELLRSILAATILVADAAKGTISMRQFVKEYDSFYHRAALDGHEANEEQRQILRDLREFVAFHKSVQEQVINAVYFGDKNTESTPLPPGLILEQEALHRLQLLEQACTTNRLIERLLSETD